MSVGNVIIAIKNRWDDQGLDTSITGGFNEGTVPEDDSQPWVQFSQVTSVVDTRASAEGGGSSGDQTEISDTLVRFNLYTRTGLAAAGVLAEAIRTAFDWAPLSITGANLLQCEFVSESITTDDKHENSRLWSIMYNVRWGRQRDASPA